MLVARCLECGLIAEWDWDKIALEDLLYEVIGLVGQAVLNHHDIQIMNES